MYIMLLVSGGALSSGNPVKKVKKKIQKIQVNPHFHICHKRFKRRCTRKRTFIANFSKKSFLLLGAKEKDYYHSIDLFKRKLLRPVPIARVNGKGVIIAFSRDTHEKSCRRIFLLSLQKNKFFFNWTIILMMKTLLPLPSHVLFLR